MLDNPASICFLSGDFKHDKSITKYAIPDGITTIPAESFLDCTKLEEIIIPDSVICIQDDAFMNCESLKSLELPASVSDIGCGVFSGCHNLKKSAFLKVLLL